MPFNFYLSALNKYFNLSHCLLVCSDYSSDLNCVYVHFLRDFCSGMPQFMFLVDTFFFIVLTSSIHPEVQFLEAS